jgi:trehalose 6-phosphate phosphatase
LPPLPANAAFFIDFDGTLVAIAERPDLVVVEPEVLALLEGLTRRFDGAVAVITGRSLDTIDRFLSPLKLPVAAEHGLMRRDGAGLVHGDPQSADAVALVAAKLEPLVSGHEGLLLERKIGSVALHYRARPELGKLCAEAVAEAVKGAPELSILPGKMVFEIRPDGVTKGTAVKAFLAEAPFRGRMPVCAGDDVTDEFAFAAVNEAGGLTIKIGEGDTVAGHRTDREGFLAWCKTAIDQAP